MTPERWKRIDQLYDEALNHKTDERLAFLGEACGDNEDLRREVESLLKAHERGVLVTKNGVSNLWVQPRDGRPARPLTDFKSDLIFDFAWSPDGDLALSRGTVTSDVVLIKNAQ